MKIEKISDSQIKCTLSTQDLKERELRISELAYGSEKARALFSELLIQASYECGFDAKDVPLMIEAIPVSSEKLVLILTKVNDPEELNINYSNISKPKKQAPMDKNIAIPAGTGADEVLKEYRGRAEKDKRTEDMLASAAASLTASGDTTSAKMLEAIFAPASTPCERLYSFDSLAPVIEAAKHIGKAFKGTSHLLKDPETGIYYLILNNYSGKPEIMNKVCNILAEYGKSVHTSRYTLSYVAEHYSFLIGDDAISQLSRLNMH